MKRYLFLCSLLFTSVFFSQNVGINTDAPNAAAAIDITAVNKGVLLPRVALLSKTNTSSPVNSPATGLLVWNTNPLMANGNGIGYYYFDGANWLRFQRRGTLDENYDQGGNGQGRTIVADAGAVVISGTDGLLITGIYGTGSIINTDITGAGTRMFFYTREAAFRAGSIGDASWDAASIGNYSIAFGRNNAAKSGRTFVANYANEASTNGINGGAFGTANKSIEFNSYAFGASNFSRNNNSLATGNLTEANGYDTFSGGNGTIAPTQSETAFGTYPKSYAKQDDTGIIYTDSNSKFYTQDRLFVIGNGATSAVKHNALDIQKDNTITINEAYTLPIADGTSTQSLKTDGSGNVSWFTSDKNTTQISLYADEDVFSMINTGYSDLGNIAAGFIPSLFEPAGKVRLKVLINYTNRTGSSQLFRLMDQSNTVLIPILSFSDRAITATEGVFESGWVNFTGGASTYILNINGKVDSGHSLDIKNVLVLVQAQ